MSNKAMSRLHQTRNVAHEFEAAWRRMAPYGACTGPDWNSPSLAWHDNQNASRHYRAQTEYLVQLGLSKSQEWAVS